MLFSSIPFLYYFLPWMMLLYFLVPFRFKNLILLIFSLIFYSWGEPKYVILMILSILTGYFFGLFIERSKSCSKYLLLLALMFHLGILVYFKYADFLIENINSMCDTSISFLNISLPIGISFYTFQIISYLVDVYRGDVTAQKRLIDFGTYISMFPQLIAGPIVRYRDIALQLNKREHSLEKVALGIRRFIFGLSKKVLLANTLGELCTIFLASNERCVLYYWLYALSFSLHIYFDFSGYSDMAIGLGKIFGFNFPENFNYPYLSSSISEFWRRWHMTLGSWFRDYVYIPLGGNRVGKTRWLFHIFVVWLLTGLWHGAAWNFILWGLMFALLLILEKIWLMKYLKKHRIFSHAYVLIAVMISFVIFNAQDIHEALMFIRCMWGFGSIPVISNEFLYYLHSYGMVLTAGMLAATPLVKNLILLVKNCTFGKRFLNLLEPVILSAFMLVNTAYLINDSYNPFLYFRF